MTTPPENAHETWTPVEDSMPADEVIVKTKVHDAFGIRCVHELHRHEGGWYHGTALVQGWVPTHWRALP